MAALPVVLSLPTAANAGSWSSARNPQHLGSLTEDTEPGGPASEGTRSDPATEGPGVW